MPNGRSRVPKIIVCDDEPEIRRILVQHLSSVGYKVRVARDGRECLDEIESEMPDLLILDLKMPRVNGLEVIRSLRKVNPTLPILVISAFHDMGQEVEQKELPLGIFTGKPFRLGDVTELVKCALLEAKDATELDIDIPQ